MNRRERACRFWENFFSWYWWWNWAWEPDLPCPFMYIGPLLIVWDWGYTMSGRRYPAKMGFSWFPD